MSLKTLAEIATIAALGIAALQYFKLEPNTLDVVSDEIKEFISEDVAKINLRFSPREYEEKESIAYPMYQAGIINPYNSGKSESLKNAAIAALDEGDFPLAIVAADGIPYDSTKSETLEHISMEALKRRDTLRFSVLAADLIPYPSTKNSVIEKITGVYDHIKRGGKLESFSLVNVYIPETRLDKYKEVYKFADSGSYMGLDEKAAKDFADNWFKDKTFEDFLVYREVFKFADSRSFMSMSEEEAAVFALDWLKKYDLDDFQVFKNAYVFASSSSFMDLDAKEAQTFAFNKLNEQRKLTSN